MSRSEDFERVENAIVTARGKTSRRERATALRGEAVAAAVDPYLAKVRTRAYAVTDEDIAALRAAGRDDDDIFELTVAAAFGESLRLRDMMLAALDASCLEEDDEA